MKKELFVGELDCSAEFLELKKLGGWDYQITALKGDLWDYFIWLTSLASGGMVHHGYQNEIVPSVYACDSDLLVLGAGEWLVEDGEDMFSLSIYFDDSLLRVDFFFVMEGQ